MLKILKIFSNKNNVIYRLISVDLDENGNYIADVQLINKSQTFKMQPEEILENDYLTDGFSPRDIRTLTYLGYLGVHAPKYAILAQKLSKKDNKLIFAIKKRGQKKSIIRTADQITADPEFISNLNQKDAHLIMLHWKKN